MRKEVGKPYISVAKAPTKIVLRKMALRLTTKLQALLEILLLCVRYGEVPGSRVETGEDASHVGRPFEKFGGREESFASAVKGCWDVVESCGMEIWKLAQFNAKASESAER